MEEKKMKVCAYDVFGLSDKMSLRYLPIIMPQEHEVQVKIEYAGVNPVDWKIREGHLQSLAEHRFPIIPGWEGAGVVTALGKAVTSFKIGDAVWGYLRQFPIHVGTYAEYACADASQVALKPKNIEMKQAASLPLVSLTAWQALFDFANLQAGQTVLIHAAAGGVGGVAVQLAKWKGATVLATASQKNHQYVHSLGAQHCIDYTQSSFETEVKNLFPKGIDVVLDCVGKQVCLPSAQLLKKGGCLVSIVDSEVEHLAVSGIKKGFVFVSPNRSQLEQIGGMLEKGILSPLPLMEMDLSRAAEALDKLKEGHVKGKIVLKI